MEIVWLAPRKRAALICFKVKQVQSTQRFIKLYDPSMGPSLLREECVGQLRAVYKARTSVARTLWNVYHID